MGERPRTWQQAERRALVADLVRTQGTLQARTEQLEQIFASRWYRLARLSWRLRRGAILRKPGPPRPAGEDSFARALNGDSPAAEAAEVRLVPAPDGGAAAVDCERRRWLAGARMPGLEGLRVAAILDPALEACLAPECALDTGFGPGDWRERLEDHPPHLLLVESALAGNGGAWSDAVAPEPGSPQAGLPALGELVAWCRERGIPSAFWATQDPLGFDRFAAAASLFDHVFSVDADRIGAYRGLPGAAARTVSALPLAAQPRLHNPIGGPPAPVFLDEGAASASPTAVPGRVFELLAGETAVVSTPHAAIEQMLGDLVPIAAGREQGEELLARLRADEGARRELATRGRRHVMGAHTYRDRLAELTTVVGFDLAAGAGEEVAVLLAPAAAEDIGEAVASLAAQSLAPNEILVGPAGDANPERDLERLAERSPGARIRSLAQRDEATRSERLRELARLAASPWVAPIAPTLRYGPHHLRDLIDCTRFAEADAIGFASPGGEGPHRYTDAVPPHAALARRELVAARGWPRDEAAMRRWFAEGVRIYAGEAGAAAAGTGA
jgi:Glycosyl transferases group 1